MVFFLSAERRRKEEKRKISIGNGSGTRISSHSSLSPFIKEEEKALPTIKPRGYFIYIIFFFL